MKRVLGETCCRCYPRRPGTGQRHMRLFDPDNSPAHVLAELAVSGEERTQAANELVALLGRCPEMPAEGFSAAICSLDPSAAQREAAGNILLARLAAGRRRWDVVALANAIASLCQAPAQRAAALQALTERIVSACEYVVDSPRRTAEIRELIRDLAGDDHDLGHARAILAAEASREAASGSPSKASALACLAAELGPAAGELAFLEEELFTAIAAQASAAPALQLAEAGLAVAQAPARQEIFRRKALEAAFALCAGSQQSYLDWERRFGDLLYFADTPGERARCLDLILEVLAREDIDDVAPASRECLASLADTAGGLGRLQVALLAKLDEANSLFTVCSIAWALQSPALESETRKRVRAALISKLDDTDDGHLAGITLGLISDLSTTEDEKSEARRMLIKISCETGNDLDWEGSLTKDGLRSLTVDIDAFQIQPCHLTNSMLAAIRWTTPLEAWLTALPTLSTPQQQPPHPEGAAGPAPTSAPRSACPLGLEPRRATSTHPRTPQPPAGFAWM